MPIKKAERLEVPKSAGDNAVAVRIESKWGTYVILSEFACTAEVAGIRFHGKFGLLYTTPAGKRRLLACGAQTLMSGGLGFQDAPALWAGRIAGHTEDVLRTAAERPSGWPPLPEGVTSYVLVGGGDQYTGFPVKATRQRSIVVDRFPLQPARRFVLLATQHMVE